MQAESERAFEEVAANTLDHLFAVGASSDRSGQILFTGGFDTGTLIRIFDPIFRQFRELFVSSRGPWGLDAEIEKPGLRTVASTAIRKLSRGVGDCSGIGILQAPDAVVFLSAFPAEYQGQQELAAVARNILLSIES